MAIEAHILSASPITANVNNENLIKGDAWKDIENKPFDSVDNKTLSTTGGVLKFKTASYNDLTDHPSIEKVVLKGNKTFADLGMEECSILDIEKIFSS